MSSLGRAYWWTGFGLVVLFALVWGWLPSAELGFDPTTDTDWATSAGAYAATVAVLLLAVTVAERCDGPRPMILTARATAAAFTLLAVSAALDITGNSTAAYAGAQHGASWVLMAPWTLAFAALVGWSLLVASLGRWHTPTRHRDVVNTNTSPRENVALTLIEGGAAR